VPRPTPHPRAAELLDACRAARPLARRWEGEFYRCCKVRYARSADLASGAGSLLRGGRWNAPGLARVVYGSTTPEASVAESLSALRRAGVAPAAAAPFVIAAVWASFDALDLTTAEALEALTLDADALARDPWWTSQWAGRESLTQALGRAAFETGLEGLLVPSAAVPGVVNLAVFPDRLPPERRPVARGIDAADPPS
jgi:RES domain-containing protein